MAAVRETGRPLVDDPARLGGVHTLAVDGTAFLAATPTRGTTFATGIVALNGRARLLDVVEGRSRKALCGWISDRAQSWRDRISVAALDPFRGYATALRTDSPVGAGMTAEMAPPVAAKRYVVTAPHVTVKCTPLPLGPSGGVAIQGFMREAILPADTAPESIATNCPSARSGN